MFLLWTRPARLLTLLGMAWAPPRARILHRLPAPTHHVTPGPPVHTSCSARPRIAGEKPVSPKRLPTRPGWPWGKSGSVAASGPCISGALARDTVTGFGADASVGPRVVRPGRCRQSWGDWAGVHRGRGWFQSSRTNQRFAGPSAPTRPGHDQLFSPLILNSFLHQELLDGLIAMCFIGSPRKLA